MGKCPALMIFLSSSLLLVLQNLHVVDAVKCFGSSFNGNSSYAQNRQKLFSTLAYKVVTSGGFYNASLGQYPNRVYALVICARGYEQEACLSCVQTLAQNIQTECPSRMDSFIWGGNEDVTCLVRSSNHPTFGNLQLTPPVVWPSPYIIEQSKNMTLFEKQWEEMVNRTLETATKAETSSVLKYYSAEIAEFTEFPDVYMLMQCTPDITSRDCKQCLGDCMMYFRKDYTGRGGGTASLPSCYFRWDLYAFHGAFGNVTKVRCATGDDEFRPFENMKLVTDPATILVLTESLVTTTCASRCLTNCYCKAYAYDRNMCLMWESDAFNLQLFDPNGGQTFFLRHAGSNISIATEGRRIVLLVVLSSLVAAATFFVGLYCFISSRRRRNKTQRDEKQSRELLEGGVIDDDEEHMCYLNLHDIMAATNSFSEVNKLGEGGFGPVYKGKLPNGMDVAIKRLSKKSSQGLTEFKNEVVLIIKLQHKNLVRLLGYCVEGDEKLLIYEYMSNKSLDCLLFDSLKSRELDWETRMKIVNGTTRGLQYLHQDSRLRIIHRDLKASNILLDDEMNPKISDFGTARIFGCKQIDDSTQRIVGTFGYMSPEYALGGMISEKSDIYSFGVLLLEIISGKKATRFVHNDQKHSLIAYAWESWCEIKGISIIDEALCGSFALKEVMRCIHIALLCVQDHPKDRPTISQTVYMLSNDNNLPIPKQPTFSNVLNGDQQLASSDYVFSINEATQTELEAR